MSNLLIDEYPLQVSPTLATKIGLNEAIVLQQIHYWIETYKKTADADTIAKHFHNNMWWIYNTYEKWQEQFPFWCLRTIKTIIKSLENKDLLIVGKFNKFGYDRTKWYTINYKVLEILENTHSANLALSKVQMLHEQKCKSCTTNTIDYTETTTEINHSNNYIDNNIKNTNSVRAHTSKEVVSENRPKEFDYEILHRQISAGCRIHRMENLYPEIVEIFDYFYKTYEYIMDKPHPKYKNKIISDIVEQINFRCHEDNIEIIPEAYKQYTDDYFKQDFKGNRKSQCDYSMRHFVTTIEYRDYNIKKQIY